MKNILFAILVVTLLGGVAGYGYLSYTTIEGTKLRIISINRITVQGDDLIIRGSGGEILILHKNILKDISIKEETPLKSVFLTVLTGRSPWLPILISEFIKINENYGIKKELDRTESILKIKLLGVTINKKRNIHLKFKDGGGVD